MPFIGNGGPANGNAHVLEMSNRATIQKLSAETLSGLTARLDNHESGLNTNAHGISNISGLSTALNSKQDIIIGATGSFTYVKTVDFVGQTVTTGIINVNNGIITSIS